MYDSYEGKTGNTATHLAHGYVTITTTAHFKIIYYNTINLYAYINRWPDSRYIIFCVVKLVRNQCLLLTFKLCKIFVRSIVMITINRNT